MACDRPIYLIEKNGEFILTKCDLNFLDRSIIYLTSALVR